MEKEIQRVPGQLIGTMIGPCSRCPQKSLGQLLRKPFQKFVNSINTLLTGMKADEEIREHVASKVIAW